MGNVLRALLRWPLLLVGLVVLGYGVINLSEGGDVSDARALVLGLGCVLCGAGIALVVQDRPADVPPPDDSTTDPGV